MASSTQDLILNRKQLQLLFDGTPTQQQAVHAFDTLFRKVGTSVDDIATIVAQIANLTPGARQTVAGGPVVAATGLPNFLPSVSASLVLTTQNVAAATPLVVSAAQGNTNTTYTFTANFAWTLAASSTQYLYVNALTGVAGATTLVPIYQYGGVPSVTNNQFTLNISEMTGYMGNGVAAIATPLVFVGECVASVSTITSTIAYVYNGFYDSGFTATLPGVSTTVTKNSNLGLYPQSINTIIECTTIDQGYAIGDQLHGPFMGYNGTANIALPIYATRNTVGFSTSTAITSMGAGSPKGAIATTTLTLASWKYKLVARRGW